MTSSKDFFCSVCGQLNERPDGDAHRELVPCAACGSNMRFRAIACAVTRAVIGRVGVLKELQADRKLRVVGISDSMAYAQVMERKFDYTNTFLHTEPHLDIEDEATYAPYVPLDLIICSDVIEHTLRPPAAVLLNLARALKPGGHLVLSAPTYLMPDTVERYPTLDGFDVEPVGENGFRVRYRTRFGSTGVDEAPVFHGGPGRVLEMRMISHTQLLQEVAAAGLEVLPAPDMALSIYGAIWPRMVERQDLPLPMDGSVILARRPA